MRTRFGRHAAELLLRQIAAQQAGDDRRLSTTPAPATVVLPTEFVARPSCAPPAPGRLPRAAFGRSPGSHRRDRTLSRSFRPFQDLVCATVAERIQVRTTNGSRRPGRTVPVSKRCCEFTLRPDWRSN